MKQKIHFNKVAIIGVGLIGGSIGMAIKKRRLSRRVVGFCHRKVTIGIALRNKSVDEGTLNLDDAIRDADLIILATPVSSIINFAKEVSRKIKHKCILIDVGSSKNHIVKSLNEIIPQNIKFVPTHPLAGSEKKGVEFASGDLFENSCCIITPAQNTDKVAVKRIKSFWLCLGARVCMMNPARHDNILAFVSHLPHILAFNLINCVPQKYFDYASGGLKDTTRIAASDPLVWRDICLSNSKQILKAIGDFQASLSKMKQSIKNHDGHRIFNTFEDAKLKKESLSHVK